MTETLIPRYVTEAEASEITSLARGTLRNLRWQGRGPRTLKINSRVVYPLADLLAWVEAGGDQ